MQPKTFTHLQSLVTKQHTQAILFLTLPEQHIRVPGAQWRRKPEVGCKSFAILNLEVIRHNDVCKQRLQLVDSEITTRAVEKRCGVTAGIRRPQMPGITHHMCRPNPKGMYSGDILTA
jgi:hypothetical protein